MPKQIIWAPLAEHDFKLVLEYVNRVWGTQVAGKFIEKTEKLINQILVQPKIFPQVNVKRKIRKCVITKHNSLFYRETKNQIEILRIFDTRQNPKNLKFT